LTCCFEQLWVISNFSWSGKILFLHDLSELEAKKSAIFSLPIHSNHVKKSGKKFGMTHITQNSMSNEQAWDKSLFIQFGEMEAKKSAIFSLPFHQIV
jgi:hypothetical protein